MKIYDVAVIGGGSAGVMAALRTVLNNDECLFFPGTPKHKKRSRAFWVSSVENMPAHLHYKKGIEEPNKESLEWLSKGPFASKFHWMKNRGVVKIEKGEDGLFHITDDKDFTYFSQFIILATGVMDIQPQIDGSIEPVFEYANAQLIDYCIRCDGHHVLKKNIAILGHTSAAAWSGIMLFERYQCSTVSLLTNGEPGVFDEETSELMNRYGFNVCTEKIIGIIGNPKNKFLEGFRTLHQTIPADFAFVSLGMIVYNELAKMLNAEIDQRGFVVTDSKGKSSVDRLYIAGDLRANAKKQIYTAWDHAVDAADEINMLIRRKKRNEYLK